MSNPLEAHLVPPGAGAGFLASRDGSFARIEPLTAAADAWLKINVDPEAAWSGRSLVIEMAYFAPLVDAIIEAGFTFERPALPN